VVDCECFGQGDLVSVKDLVKKILFLGSVCYLSVSKLLFDERYVITIE